LKPRSEPGNTAASLPAAGISLPSQSLENTLPWCRAMLCAVRMRSSLLVDLFAGGTKVPGTAAVSFALRTWSKSRAGCGITNPFAFSSSSASPHRRRFKRFRLLTQSGSSNSKLSSLDESLSQDDMTTVPLHPCAHLHRPSAASCQRDQHVVSRAEDLADLTYRRGHTTS